MIDRPDRNNVAVILISDAVTELLFIRARCLLTPPLASNKIPLTASSIIAAQSETKHTLLRVPSLLQPPGAPSLSRPNRGPRVPLFPPVDRTHSPYEPSRHHRTAPFIRIQTSDETHCVIYIFFFARGGGQGVRQ